MNTERMMDRKRLNRIFSVSLVLMSSGALTFNTATRGVGAIAKADDASISKSIKVKRLRPTDVEIRFEFYAGWTPNVDDSSAPSFIVIGRDGRAKALRYELRYQTKPVASYEGVLPEAEVQRLFARVGAAFRLPKYRKDYDRRLIYEDDFFYLAVKSESGKVKQMSGGDAPRPDEVRALITDMRQLWRLLPEVPPAYAYLTGRPIEKYRLKLLRSKYRVEPTPVVSLPSDLQALLIPVVTQSRNFYPLTQAQYERYQKYHRPLIYKGIGYEPMLILSSNEVNPIKQ